MLNRAYYHTLAVILTGILVICYFSGNKILLMYSSIIGVMAVLSPPFAKLIHLIWFKIAFLLSSVMSILWFSIIFYFLLFPLKLLKLIFIKNDKFFFDKSKQSLFIDRNVRFSPSHLKNSW